MSQNIVLLEHSPFRRISKKKYFGRRAQPVTPSNRHFSMWLRHIVPLILIPPCPPKGVGGSSGRLAANPNQSARRPSSPPLACARCRSLLSFPRPGGHAPALGFASQPPHDPPCCFGVRWFHAAAAPAPRPLYVFSLSRPSIMVACA